MGRVNLGGGVNSFGTAIGPIVVAFALFGTTAAITEEKIASLSLSKVIILYIGVGLLLLLLLLFSLSRKKFRRAFRQKKQNPRIRPSIRY
jgi:FHS family L-fucose permease-like MFS transporter